MDPDWRPWSEEEAFQRATNYQMYTTLAKHAKHLLDMQSNMGAPWPVNSQLHGMQVPIDKILAAQSHDHVDWQDIPAHIWNVQTDADQELLKLDVWHFTRYHTSNLPFQTPRNTVY